MSVKLLIKHHLEFLSFKEGYTGTSESILVKMPHSWKSHVAAHIWCRPIFRSLSTLDSVYTTLNALCTG